MNEEEKKETPVDPLFQKIDDGTAVESDMYQKLINSKRVDKGRSSMYSHFIYKDYPRFAPFWHAHSRFSTLHNHIFRFNGTGYDIRIAIEGRDQFKATLRDKGKNVVETDMCKYFSSSGGSASKEFHVDTLFDYLKEHNIYCDDDLQIIDESSSSVPDPASEKPILFIGQDCWYYVSIYKEDSYKELYGSRIKTEELKNFFDPMYLINLISTLTVRKKKATTGGWGA